MNKGLRRGERGDGNGIRGVFVGSERENGTNPKPRSGTHVKGGNWPALRAERQGSSAKKTGKGKARGNLRAQIDRGRRKDLGTERG